MILKLRNSADSGSIAGNDHEIVSFSISAFSGSVDQFIF